MPPLFHRRSRPQRWHLTPPHGAPCGFHIAAGTRVHRHWWLFVPFKGLVIPLLILRLDGYRQRWPALASTGMVLVACALTVAVGRWLGWIGGVLSVHGAPPF